MKLLNYYLSSGILKKNDIDLGKLPSQIINDLSNDKNEDLIWFINYLFKKFKLKKIISKCSIKIVYKLHKVDGYMIYLLVKVDIFIPMVMYIKVLLLIIKKMVMVYMSMQMKNFMMVIIKMILNRVKVNINIKMVLSMKAIGIKVKKMDMENYNYLMVLYMKVILLMVNMMVMEPWNFQMVKFIEDIGKMI